MYPTTINIQPLANGLHILCHNYFHQIKQQQKYLTPKSVKTQFKIERIDRDQKAMVDS